MNLNRLRGIRCERGKTQKECAAAIGSKYIMVYSRKEHGKSEFLVSQMNALVDFLKMSATEVNEVFFDGKLTVS